MRKSRTLVSYRHASSKRASAIAGRELTLLILALLQERKPVSDNLFATKKTKTRKFREMQHLGYINDKYAITKRGHYVLNEEKIWSLTIPTPAQWDRKWRMVLYDIPARKSKQRDALRLRLKELGLVRYQNSVWVYPYPLEKVIKEISDFYFISDCVLFAVAEKLHSEQRLLKHFKLS